MAKILLMKENRNCISVFDSLWFGLKPEDNRFSLFSFTLSTASFKTSFIAFFNTSCKNNSYFMLLWIECNDCKQQCIKKLQWVSEILLFCVCVSLFLAICSSSSTVLFLLRAGVCGWRTAAVLCKQVKAVTSLWTG